MPITGSSSTADCDRPPAEPILTGKVIRIRTGLDTHDKFPQISDEELLDKVQQQTFRYFWEGAEPVSGHGARAHHVGVDGHHRRHGASA